SESPCGKLGAGAAGCAGPFSQWPWERLAASPHGECGPIQGRRDQEDRLRGKPELPGKWILSFNLLVLECSCLDYCNALLTGLPACVVKPLQIIQTAPARLVFNQPKRAHVTPLLIELHWLPVAARIKFKSLMLAYRVLAGSAPTYLNALVRPNVTS